MENYLVFAAALAGGFFAGAFYTRLTVADPLRDELTLLKQRIQSVTRYGGDVPAAVARWLLQQPDEPNAFLFLSRLEAKEGRACTQSKNR